MKYLLVSLLTVAVTIASPTTRDGFTSEKPATHWEQALVTGNGTLGMMVMGGTADERIIFNHEELYEPLRDEVVKAPEVASFLPEIRALQSQRKYKEAQDLFWQRCQENGLPEILWTPPYHPAFALTIQSTPVGETRAYSRTCDFTTGELVVRFTDGVGTLTRKSFVSRADGLAVTEITRSGEAKLDLTLALEPQGVKGKALIEKPIITAEDDFLTFRQDYQKTSAGFEGAARIITDGKRTIDGASLKITGATSIQILVDIARLDDFSQSEVAKLKSKLANTAPDYSKRLAAHAAIHGPMYRRVAVDFGATAASHKLSTEALIAAQKALPTGEIHPTLLEKVVNMGRFTLIASSGKYPPNLMGIWNGEYRPKWSGDFTLDANVNLQIATANIGSLPEATASYASLFTKLLPDWRDNAMRLYGCRGIVSGIRTSGTDGHQTHHDAGFPGASWTGGAQWLTLPLIESYETTGDRTFLAETVMPFLEGIAAFYLDFLTLEDADGKVIFSPSYSPENWPTGSVPMSVNTTMDVTLCREALTYVIRFSELLRRNADLIPKWQALLAKLPDYRINADGALAEYLPSHLPDRYDHRHVSHLYGVWPGHEINPEETPVIFEAAKVAAEKRGAGNGSAHGLAHMALIATRLKHSDLVEANVARILTDDYLLPSLFTYHNPGRIYNADALHSLPAVIMEMLAYSRPGEIELIPALGDGFAKGTITGISTRTQATIDSLAWDLEKRTVTAHITSLIDQDITLRLRRGIASIQRDGAPIASDRETAQIALKKGETTQLSFSF